MKLDYNFSSCTILNCKWIKDLSIRLDNINMVKDKVGMCYYFSVAVIKPHDQKQLKEKNNSSGFMISEQYIFHQSAEAHYQQ